MNKSRRSQFWICGILAVVCLVLLNCLVLQFQKLPGRAPVLPTPACSDSVPNEPPANVDLEYRKPPLKASENRRVAGKEGSGPQASSGNNTPAGTHAEHVASAPSDATQLATQVSVAAQPKRKTRTIVPLGYAENAEGRVEAIISMGDGVQVVHEGDVVDDGLKVARIAPTAVELIDNSATSAPVQVMAEAVQSNAQAAPSNGPQALPRSDSATNSSSDNDHRLLAALSARAVQPSNAQAVGYAVTADGRVDAIVAEGEHVSLSQASKTFPQEFRSPTPSPATVETAKSSLPAVNPAESTTIEAQPFHADSSTPEQSEMPLVASLPDSSKGDNPQGVVSTLEPGASLPETMQAEPLADYSAAPGGSGARQAEPVPQMAQPSGLAIGNAAPRPTTAESANRLLPLGFVEKAGGEKEAIIELHDQVYIVHEGELFAEKYRVMHITSSTVDVVEESTKGLAPPPEIEPDPKATAHPPVSTWRGPPAPAGSLPKVLPLGVVKTEGLIAGIPVASALQARPEPQVEPCHQLAGEQVICSSGDRVGMQSALQADGGASPPAAAQTIGLVEKAGGESEAIVASEEEVYLVPFGKESVSNSTLPNSLPGIAAQSPLGILTLTLPAPPSNLTSTTSQTNFLQLRP